MTSTQCQDEDTEKLIKLTQFKISRAKSRIAKVQEGFEGRIYNLDEAKKQINKQQETISEAEEEIRRLNDLMMTRNSDQLDTESIRKKLETLRDGNLSKATFDEKLEFISLLGIRVYPSENLTSMRVTCELNLENCNQIIKTTKQYIRMSVW